MRFPTSSSNETAADQTPTNAAAAFFSSSPAQTNVNVANNSNDVSPASGGTMNSSNNSDVTITNSVTPVIQVSSATPAPAAPSGATSFFKRYSNWAHSSSTPTPPPTAMEGPNTTNQEENVKTSPGAVPELHIISELPDDQKTLVSTSTEKFENASNHSSVKSESQQQPQPHGIYKKQKGGNVGGKRKVTRPCQTHSFHTEAVEVQHMEKGLLKLLDDFNSGKLRAFGQGFSMEQMGQIRNQQENLARLHFELGARQDVLTPLSEEGLRATNRAMDELMERLEKLSVSIGQLNPGNNEASEVAGSKEQNVFFMGGEEMKSPVKKNEWNEDEKR